MKLTLLPLAAVLACGQTAHWTIEPYAGSGWTGDGGKASEAVLLQPRGLMVESTGAVLIADAADHRIRRVHPDGTIRTVAGTGAPSSSQLHSPYSTARDRAGNLYIADLGNRLLRRIGPDGVLTTVAGGGETEPPLQGTISARTAKLQQPRAVAVAPDGSIYFADFAAHRIYAIQPSGMLGTVSAQGEPALSFPAALAFSASGELLIADSGNKRVRVLSAGVLRNLTDAYGREVELANPSGLAVGADGTLYIADGSDRITAVPAVGPVRSVAPGGDAVAVGSAGEIYAARGRVVYRVSQGQVWRLAGGAAGDGADSSRWRFHAPAGLARDAGGSLLIADSGSGRIRRLDPAGVLSTLSAQLESAAAVAVDALGRIYACEAAAAGLYRLDGPDSMRLLARTRASSMTFDRYGLLWTADATAGTLRTVTPEGVVSEAASGLSSPAGLAFAADGNLWIAEAGAARVRPLREGAAGESAAAGLAEPRGIRFDNRGRLFVADAGLGSVLMRDETGNWSALVPPGSLVQPLDVLPDPDGSVLVADAGAHFIRRLRPPSAIAPAMTLPRVRVRHAATGREEPLAPGQLAVLEGIEPGEVRSITGGAEAIAPGAPGPGTLILLSASLRPGVQELAVRNGSGDLYKFRLDVVPAAPALFTGPGGEARALNTDGQPNHAGRPAARGSVVSFFVTGDGAVAPSGAEVGGRPSEVVWSGPAPGLPGVLQVQVRMPGGFTPSGALEVRLYFGLFVTPAGVTVHSQ